jgi:hypothetical protein
VRPKTGAGLSIRRAIVLHLALAGAGHLAWETAQLPLYTIWWTGTRREILFALIHCTGGDLLISAAALGLASLIARLSRRPFLGGGMILTAILLGLSYSVFSEWLNTNIRQSWSYTEVMPVLPPLGTGLTPFLQWLLVPGLAFATTAYAGCRYVRVNTGQQAMKSKRLRRRSRSDLPAVVGYRGDAMLMRRSGPHD